MQSRPCIEAPSACRCERSNSSRGTKPASIPTRLATAIRVRLRAASTTGSMRRAARRWQTDTYQVYAEVPGKLLSAAQNLIGAVADQLAEAPLSIDDASLRFFFDAMHFVALAEQFGAHSIFDITLATDRHAPRDKISA